MRPFLPLLTFIAVFLGSGFYYLWQGVDFAFYQLPSPVATLPAVILAFFLMKGTFDRKLTTFMQGLGDYNVLTMCMIYLLAGAFGSVVKAIGGVDATIYWGLKVIPESLMVPGFFFLAALISTAIGTSMGTISALGPIALGLSSAGGLDKTLVFGALVGGAMFGDNLSFISDTTIAATRSQGASMRDKFRVNFAISLPAAILTMILLYFTVKSGAAVPVASGELYKALPYAVVLILALLGLNVFLVLMLGIVLAGALGLFFADYTVLRLGQDIYAGFKDMQEIFLLSMVMGGLGQMMKEQGGIQTLKSWLKKLQFRSARLEKMWPEFSIALSVSLANFAVANNTVAIIITGDLAREVAKTEGVPPARSASILDIYSCVVQGVIPYGAQILLASQMAKISPLGLAGSVQYCYFLGLVTIVSMVWRTLRR
ncbi:Na+/H+ antiporter NhaC family protein [Bdellovibrio bacteriovorus]|uniref:NhaC protein n=1 Tax=Bdellovibrio bacteriovorus (strain ATCC 15356 / DSM 50701 / NCIMB 9529 / HD100) TaxID=264462 RepID=Q6MR40_BDEBA|nr:Na+/H+ antiporter NhaC family protein [Bdellovibrio bacteriovorus]CAE77918.1 nhaC [Bdellovibrio bacteriovorus HD100]